MRVFLTILLLQAIVSSGQSFDSIWTIDLSKDWKIYNGENLAPYSSKADGDKAIYLDVDPGRYQPNAQLVIQSIRPLSVYLNYKLLVHHEELVKLNMDSLKELIPTPWMFSVYQREGISGLSTRVLTIPPEYSQAEIPLRGGNYYLDFSIIVVITLMIIFIVLLRTNTRLTLDYFNFVKLFSIQEREDSLLNSRISSSVNILFYAFSSVALGFALLTIFHFGQDYVSLAESFRVSSLGDAFWQWLKLSLFVLILLIIRLIVFMLFGALFDFKEAISLQFYNSVRLGFFTAVFSFLICLSFFILKMQQPEHYGTLLRLVVSLLVFWVLVIGLKLLRRSSFRFFHLFSYLCASELIPIVILVKVLNS